MLYDMDDAELDEFLAANENKTVSFCHTGEYCTQVATTDGLGRILPVGFAWFVLFDGDKPR